MISVCASPGVTQTNKHPHLCIIHMNTHIKRITHNMKTCAAVTFLSSEIECCLLHISSVGDINTMLMKPLPPSFICLFHSAEWFEQQWGAANSVTHNEACVSRLKALWFHCQKLLCRKFCMPSALSAL